MEKYQYTMGKNLDLKEEQERTLSSPKLKSNWLLKMFFLTSDLLYGFKTTLPKVKVLEILARYPYWAWENGAYHKMTRLYAATREVKRSENRVLIDLIDLGRHAQDNEDLHLFMVEEVIRQKGIVLSVVRQCVIARLLAMGYYYITRFVFFLSPCWALYMNAAFESHAEHVYMSLAKEHPEWDDEPIDSMYFDIYPRQNSLGDLIRRIALDERDHMNHSLEAIDDFHAASRKAA